MGWIYLMGGIFFEVAGTAFLKDSNSFTRLWPSLFSAFFFGLSLASAALALKFLDLGMAYAIWSGLGTALVVAVGVFWFKEPLGTLKVVSLALILAGIAGLKLSERASLAP